MVDELPNIPTNGRGAVGAPAGRFEKYTSVRMDDGWQSSLLEEEEWETKLKTNLHIDTSRSVINEITSPDLPRMRSINIYRGCEHGCIYCFARPSHSYLGFSAGLEFETEIMYKPDTPEVLLRELAAKKYEPFPITLGSNTDCFQPVERGLKLARHVLEILSEHNHPVAIITKSALVARDIDILAPMAAKGLARVNISLTTLDPALARVMEPRAAAPYKRLATMKALVNAGIPVTVMAAPLIPALTDMELENILEAAYEMGARRAHYTLVRLPYEVKDLFTEWVRTHRPDRPEHVLSLIRQTRGGKLYDADFSQRRSGTGVYAELIAQRFKKAKKRIGYSDAYPDMRLDLFRKPELNGQVAFDFK
ncbi:MAG TPA: PA0069 family radical SAM protein [Alphaproteobacteria bacterium]|nr:PA0069 family radical SAM protein [Alphaproteobacteria bacterium]